MQLKGSGGGSVKRQLPEQLISWSDGRKQIGKAEIVNRLP